MWSRSGFVFLMVAIASFPTDASPSLQGRYGKPISEVYVVRPGVVASVQYGANGDVCAIVVKPERPKYPLTSRSNTIGDYMQVQQILAELASEKERGKLVGGALLDLVCVPNDPNFDCGGSEEDWEKLTIRRIGYLDNQQYAAVHWKREECTDVYPEVH